MKGRGLLLLGVPSADLSPVPASSPVLSPVQWPSSIVARYRRAILFHPAMPYVCSGMYQEPYNESTVSQLLVWLGTATGTAGVTPVLIFVATPN